MQTAVLAAPVAAASTLAAALIADFLQRRRDSRLKNLEFKLDRYEEFLAGFAEMGSQRKTHEAHLKIANAVNTMNLWASPPVLRQVYSLLDYVQSNSSSSYSVAEQDRIIRRIIQEIRRDLGQSTSGLQDFPFRTISPGTRPGEVIQH